jgi:hypothetical protein
MEVEEAALQAVAVHPSSMARQVTETNKIIREGLLRDSSSEKGESIIFFRSEIINQGLTIVASSNQQPF